MEHLPPFGKKTGHADRKKSDLDDALLLLHLDNGCGDRPTKEQLSTGINVAVGFRMVKVVGESVEALVEMREPADALFDGCQAHVHHHLNVRGRDRDLDRRRFLSRRDSSDGFFHLLNFKINYWTEKL